MLLENVIGDMERRFETAVRPVRKGVLERFPVVFLLAVTTGVGAVSVGIERILLSYDLFADSPWITLGLGFIILAITGTVYKKLG